MREYTAAWQTPTIFRRSCLAARRHNVAQVTHATYAGGRCSVAARMKGSALASEKLSVVVRVDVDGEQIQIAATGRVTTLSLQGLYPVVQRTKSLGGGLGVEMDLSQATIDEDALRQLQVYSEIHEVPVRLSQDHNNVTALPSREPQTASRAA